MSTDPPEQSGRAALLDALMSRLPQSFPWSYRRLKDGRLGRATSVATARRHYRSGRWVADERALSCARLMSSLWDSECAEERRRALRIVPDDEATGGGR